MIESAALTSRNGKFLLDSEVRNCILRTARKRHIVMISDDTHATKTRAPCYVHSMLDRQANYAA
eukprot:1448-Heterococcus_DN1.PRE.2